MVCTRDYITLTKSFQSEVSRGGLNLATSSEVSRGRLKCCARSQRAARDPNDARLRMHYHERTDRIARSVHDSCSEVRRRPLGKYTSHGSFATERGDSKWWKA